VKSPDDYGDSPETTSPLSSRRDSTATKRSSTLNSPMKKGMSMSGFANSATFASQNRWMTGMHGSNTDVKYSDAYSGSNSGANSTYGTQNGSANGVNGYRGSTNAFSFEHSNGTAGFPSSNVRSTGAGWQTSPPAYGVKQENHYQWERIAWWRHEHWFTGNDMTCTINRQEQQHGSKDKITINESWWHKQKYLGVGVGMDGHRHWSFQSPGHGNTKENKMAYKIMEDD
jgi:hypothetical protein